jgi:RNA polymerase sigma-70 factor (ECF subfamily)
MSADLELMSDVAAQNAGAQRKLSLRLIARVRRLARVFVRHAADADDAAQEALIEILKAAPSYRGESSIERWSDRIAIRTSLRVARSLRRTGKLLDGAMSPDELPIVGKDFESSEMLTHIRTHMDRLAEPRREVLLLRCVMGYSIEEVGELTGASPNTVKDRLLRAREEIRQMIRRENAQVRMGVVNG